MGPAGRKTSEEAAGLSAASDFRKHGLGAGEGPATFPVKGQKRQEENGPGLGSSLQQQEMESGEK